VIQSERAIDFMRVRQAIVSTPDSRALKQNKLVAKSDSIDSELEELLCCWSPQRNDLALGTSQSISFFQPRTGTFVLSRSVLGSNFAGAHQVMTHAILFDLDQLRSYRNNIALVFHVLRSQGLMSFQASPSERLPMLKVPEQAFEELGELTRAEYSVETEKISHAIEIHKNIVVLGLDSPLRFLCSFLAELPVAERLDYSFATGLKVSDERRFTFQFFPHEKPDLLQELARQQMRTISLGSKSPSGLSRVTGSFNDC
jgi:hypothetical protein